MKKIIGIFVFCAINIVSFSQAELLEAEHKYINGNMRGALTIYRNILEKDPENYKAQFGEAECYYQLKKYNDAFSSLDKAAGIKQEKTKEIVLFYAQCYHRTNDLDRAISEYKSFQKMVKPKSEEYQEAEKCIRECEFAKRKLQKPADVKIYNLGEAVNSRFEEYAPSISSKANLLVFTSRRENTTSPDDRKGKHIFEEGDYKFYEDIYVSKLDSLSNWEDCTNKLGDINTTENDGVLSISPDNSGVFVYKYDLQGGGDIYFSKALPNFKWAKPESLPKNINTSFFEGSTSLTADGNKMYFVSDRLGGLGSCDIYYSEKKGGVWSNPMNLGEIVNTDGDEKFVFIHPNGRTLFFASNGHLGMGSYDIFRTELVNELWTKPINLGYPINSVNEESTFSLTADNKTMYISAEYTQVSDNGVANYGERDIYKIDISNYPLMAEGYDKLTHGQLICYLKEANSGEAMKGVQIIVESLEDGEITEAFTDKSGMARINLRSQATYKVTAKKGDKIFSEEITLIEKVQNWEIRL